jgi:hypothetical protein
MIVFLIVSRDNLTNNPSNLFTPNVDYLYVRSRIFPDFRFFPTFQGLRLHIAGFARPRYSAWLCGRLGRGGLYSLLLLSLLSEERRQKTELNITIKICFVKKIEYSTTKTGLKPLGKFRKAH